MQLTRSVPLKQIPAVEDAPLLANDLAAEIEHRKIEHPLPLEHEQIQDAPRAAVPVIKRMNAFEPVVGRWPRASADRARLASSVAIPWCEAMGVARALIGRDRRRRVHPSSPRQRARPVGRTRCPPRADAPHKHAPTALAAVERKFPRASRLTPSVAIPWRKAMGVAIPIAALPTGDFCLTVNVEVGRHSRSSRS